MVSKGKILGQSSLVLISIGSTKFPFFRIESSVNKLDGNKYKIIKDFLSPNQFLTLIKKADKIIIHGGPATILLAVKHFKFMPLVIPRLAKYKEHVNNHQLFFVKYLRNKLPNNLKKYFVINEKIDGIINKYLTEENKTNKLNKFLFIANDKSKLLKNLDLYINK